MKTESGKTAKTLREKHPVPNEVKEKLKYFTRTKKAIVNALKEGDKTVPQLAEQLNMPGDEVMFQLMSLLKYGIVKVGEMDDMDEFYYYKLKGNGKDKS